MPTQSASKGEPRRLLVRRRLVAALLIICAIASFGYAAVTTVMGVLVVRQTPLPVSGSPAEYGLSYRDVLFPARPGGPLNIMIHGWFIPGVLPSGQETTQRTLIMVHGANANRADPDAGLLSLSSAMAHQGFAVLAFDMRGNGQSPPAPFSLGYYEQRDVLGAVDFLERGPIPYPSLGRTRIIGGWGVSMGAITLLLAAAKEPGIKAIVVDSAYPDIIPILEREVPKQSGLPAFLTPGALLADRLLYGIDWYDVNPGDVVASLAPRPLLFIQGSGDLFNPPYNLGILVHDAEAAPNANVQSWLVPGAGHAQSYNVEGVIYVERLVTFYNAALGPDTSS